MSKKLYDILKIVGRIILPVGTFIAAICQIWGLPYGDKITATLAALAALINSVLSIDSVGYWADHQVVKIPDYTSQEEDPTDEYDP